MARDSGAGFQEEKYQSLYLPMRWVLDDLLRVLDTRVDALVARRYQKSSAVTHRDLLPKSVYKTPIGKFIGDRAKRPRDVISFFNKCIEVAEGKPKVNVDALKRAEGEYSRQRLRALGDEWHADLPGLLDFVGILKKRSPSFSLSQVEYNDVSDLCLNSAIEYPSEPGTLRQQARDVVEGLVGVNDFKRTLFMIFYRIGLVGLKLEAFQSASWVDESGQSVSRSEIDDSISGGSAHDVLAGAWDRRGKTTVDGDANEHSHIDLPLVLVGGAGGVKGGKVLRHSKDTPMNN